MKSKVLSFALLAIFVFSVVASGCIGGEKTTTQTGGAGYAEQIVIGVTDKVTDLDPANAYDFYTWEVLNNIMEGLVKYKPGTLEIEPALAES